MKLQKAMFVLFPEALEQIYPAPLRAGLGELVDIAAPQTKESIAANPSLLADIEILISGWGAPVMDGAFLEAAPKLRAVFYGAGSVRRMVTPAFWERNILLTTAVEANSLPVSEYVLGVVLLSLKHFWKLADLARAGGSWFDPARQAIPGCYRSQVGFISMGKIARRTLELLQPFDLHRLAYCPWLTEHEARVLDVERASIEEVFARSDVVSLHTPNLPETQGLITGEHLAAMKQGATFINSARGAVVREQEMIEALIARPDLTAVLDVTHPEPPPADSPLLTLPNVILTPHIAGSLGPECSRMGQYMVDELRRYIQGAPLKYRITRELAETMA